MDTMPKSDAGAPGSVSITSPDTRRARLDVVRRLLPDLFDGEGKLDETALRSLLPDGGPDGAERFGLEWPGKQESKRRAFTPSRAALRPDHGRSVEAGTTGNLIIEGENLEVLKLLQASYSERIKLIYIDPPYNTGSGFVYADDFSEGRSGNWRRLAPPPESDGHKHSAWLSMMQSRLLVARCLLRGDGAIVVHIDENEGPRLRLLMEDVFGPANTLGDIVWDKRNPKGDSGGVSCQHESILCFAKDANAFKAANPLRVPKRNAERMLAKAAMLFGQVGQRLVPEAVRAALRTLGIAEEQESHARVYTLADANADFQRWLRQQGGLSRGEAMYKHIDAAGEVYRLVSMAWPNNKRAPDAYFIPLKHDVTGKDCPVPAKGWRNPPATMADLLARKLIVFGADETVQPQRKYRLRDTLQENLPSLLYYGGSDDALLSELGIPFENPKPVDVSRRIIQAFTGPGDTVLDVFAGSGTVGHAVLAQNAETGGSRRFILVQMAERTPDGHPARTAGFETISALCIERVRRAGTKLRRERPEASFDAGFRVLRLADSSIPQALLEPDPDKTEAVIAEIAVKNGFGLFYTVEALPEFKANAVYRLAGNGQSALVCLDAALADTSAEALRSYADEKLIVARRALDASKKPSVLAAFGDNLSVM